MPIRVLGELPAVRILQDENIFIMKKPKDIFRKIRSLRMLILNLMPKKIETENQFLRILSHSSLPIDVQLLRIDRHISKNTPTEHLNKFYCSFTDIQNQRFDGLIVTGAPLGLIDFADITFWPQIKQLFIWSKHHVHSVLFVCWAVQAALQVLYGVPKMVRKDKLVGIYQHRTIYSDVLLTQGFDEVFFAPHSRYSDFSRDLIYNHTDLKILAESDDAGMYLLISRDNRWVFVTGHPEYELFTLSQEYYRDMNLGLNPNLPQNYFPYNNPKLVPTLTWRSHAYLLFSNWINYYVHG